MSLRETWVYRIYLSTVNKNLLDDIVDSVKRTIKEVDEVNVKESNIVNNFYLVEIYSKSRVDVHELENLLEKLGLEKNNYKVDAILTKRP